MTRTPGTHGCLCECAHRSCRERLFLNPADYTRMRALGTVVSARCARLDRRNVIARFGEVVAVQTAFSRIGAAA